MKTYSNTYPIDAPYGTGTIHYFNIVDKEESNEEGWQRYEADYEIIGDYANTSTSRNGVKTLLNIQYSHEAQQQFIEWANTICGYPDNTGTTTYANPSEPIITYNEDGSIKEQVWLTKVTHDLQEKAIVANDNTYSFVAGEILADGTIIVTDTTISNVTDLNSLVDNAKNYSIKVDRPILEQAEMETVEALLGDGNSLGDGL